MCYTYNAESLIAIINYILTILKFTIEVIQAVKTELMCCYSVNVSVTIDSL